MSLKEEKELLRRIAEKNLRSNLVSSSQGELIVAGARQFRTAWVRDFCYAVPGLLRLGWIDLVDRQLRMFFSFRNPYLPRGVDVTNVKLRVLSETVGSWLPLSLDWSPEKKLIPEYLGEHGTPAFDSGLLFLLALAELKQKKPVSWITEKEEQEILDQYQPDATNGLLSQPAFSDWQDSVRREGPVLLTHLLYLEAKERFPHLQGKIDPEKVFSAFYDEANGLWREFPRSSVHCLDSHCLLLKSSALFPESNKPALANRLRESALWHTGGIPGIPTAPPYGAREQAWTTRCIGLGRYHDGFLWGWLSAEAFAVAEKFGFTAEAERILGLYASQLTQDETFWEILRINGSGSLEPYRNFLYTSEGPFTWSAAKWLEALG